MINNANNRYYETFKPFLSSRDLRSSFQNAVVPLTKPEETLNKSVIAGSAIGTILPMMLIQAYQHKPNLLSSMKGLSTDCFKATKSLINHTFKESKFPAIQKFSESLKLDYGLKEMLFVSIGSILGGMSAGIATSKKKDHTNKIKESLFQISNVSVTTSLIAGMLQLLKKAKTEKSAPKIAAVIGGIAAGMPLAGAISNKINNTFFNQKVEDNRKLKPKDALVHVDDFLGALVLAKVPFANNLHVDKIMPLLFANCGYEAGSKD